MVGCGALCVTVLLSCQIEDRWTPAHFVRSAPYLIARKREQVHRLQQLHRAVPAARRYVGDRDAVETLRLAPSFVHAKSDDLF